MLILSNTLYLISKYDVYMESDKLVVESDTKKSSFLEHVFNFEQDSKNQFLNILQYTVIAIIPVIFLNKTVSKIIPEVDEEKSSYLMVMELLGQAILIFFGMTLIHRFVTYFPTYSKVAYAPFHTTNIILLFLIIAASFQTRIGEKTNILIDRMFDIIEGRATLSGEKKEDESKKKGGQKQQMVGQNGGGQQQIPMHQPSRADVGHMGSTNISQLQANESGPNFNSMYAGPNNPMPDALSPGPGHQMQEAFSEPMAANAMGGAPWSSF